MDGLQVRDFLLVSSSGLDGLVLHSGPGDAWRGEKAGLTPTLFRGAGNQARSVPQLNSENFLEVFSLSVVPVNHNN